MREGHEPLRRQWRKKQRRSVRSGRRQTKALMPRMSAGHRKRSMPLPCSNAALRLYHICTAVTPLRGYTTSVSIADTFSSRRRLGAVENLAFSIWHFIEIATAAMPPRNDSALSTFFRHCEARRAVAIS